MTLTSRIRRLFSRRPVVVKTYHVDKTKWTKLRDEKNEELAREVGWPWPLAGRRQAGG